MFILGIWPRVVPDGAVFVIPPFGRMDSSNKLYDKARITAREQFLSHAPFADVHVPQKLLCKRRKAGKANDLIVQAMSGRQMKFHLSIRPKH